MSFRVDTTTLLFDDLTPREADDLEQLAEDIVIHGRVSEHPSFRTWCETLGYDDRQKLLLLSTAFPQRVLLSVLRARKKFTAG